MPTLDALAPLAPAVAALAAAVDLHADGELSPPGAADAVVAVAGDWAGLTAVWVGADHRTASRVVRGPETRVPVQIDGHPKDGRLGGALGLFRQGVLVHAFGPDDAVFEEHDRYRFTADLGGEPPAAAEAPAAVVVRADASGTDALVRWDAVDGADGYRLYFGTGPFADLHARPHLHTRRLSATLSRLVTKSGVAPEVLVVAERRGTPGAVAAPVAVVRAEAGPLPTAHRARALRSCTVAPGESQAYALADHFVLAPRADEPSSAPAWDDVAVEARALGGGCTATASAGVVTVSAPAGASAGDQTVVLVRMRRDGFEPTWFAFCAGVGSRTQLTAQNAYGVHVAPGGAVRLPAAPLAGHTSRPAHEGSWRGPLDAVSDRPDVEVEDLAGAVTLVVTAPDEPGDEPVVAVFRGERGWSAVTLQRSLAGLAAPFLPVAPFTAGVEVEVEATGQWAAPDWEGLYRSAPRLRSETWLRMLVPSQDGSGPKLYDIGRHGLPEPVHFAAPTFWGPRWFDRDRFPADVSDVLAHGADGSRRAVYRGGLTSPAAVEAAPGVSALETDAGVDSVRLSWATSHPTTGEPDGDLLVAAYLERVSGGGSMSRWGYGSALFEGLAPNTTYRAWLAWADVDRAQAVGAVVTFRTERAAPPVTVEGFAEAGDDGAPVYRYRYTLGQGAGSGDWTAWSGPAGGLETDAVVETVSGAPVETHTVVVHYGPETVRVAVATVWRRPPGPVSFERDVHTGYVVPAAAFDRPTFRRSRYAGTATHDDVHRNVFGPGTVRTRPVGFLPPAVPGRLEDYVEAVFVGPDGREIGATAVLAVPTELSVRVRVTAHDGETPVVNDVRYDTQL